MPKKLTKTQAILLEKLLNGWEAGTSSNLNGRSWIQHGGLGKGGPSETVRIDTLIALDKAGHIRNQYGFPTSKWKLTSQDPS